MDAVWVGKAEVSISPKCVLELDGAGAFVWCATQASSHAVFVDKVDKMFGNYGLIPIEYEEVRPAVNLTEMSDELFEIVSRAELDPTYTLYGTFHCYPHHTS